MIDNQLHQSITISQITILLRQYHKSLTYDMIMLDVPKITRSDETKLLYLTHFPFDSYHKARLDSKGNPIIDCRNIDKIDKSIGEVTSRVNRWHHSPI